MAVGEPHRRWNIEKAAFFAASAWLLLTALHYLRAPEVGRWGPARTGMVVGETPFVPLDPPPPIDLAGGNPFVGRGGPPPPPPPPPPAPEGGGKHSAGAAPQVNCEFVGSVQVGRHGRWFVLEDRATERYYCVRRGERIPELGLRVLGASGRLPAVEHLSPRED